MQVMHNNLVVFSELHFINTVGTRAQDKTLEVADK